MGKRRAARFARYADDFLVIVRSAKAAEPVMASLTRFVEGRLRLVVNPDKSRTAPLRQCTFLGFQIGARGRRVRLSYWKQWKRPRTPRHHLVALGIPKDEVRMATRSRKGYWRMSHNGIVQRALTNDRPHAQGVPDMRTSWIVLHYGPKAQV